MTDLVTTDWQRVRRFNNQLNNMDKGFSKTSPLRILTGGALTGMERTGDLQMQLDLKCHYMDHGQKQQLEIWNNQVGLFSNDEVKM